MTTVHGQSTDVSRTSGDNPAPRETETKRSTYLGDERAGGRRLAPTTIATEQTIRLRSIDRLDALAVALADLRPDWDPSRVRAVLARTRGAWTDVVRRAFLVTIDPDTKHPERIENADLRAYEPTPRALSITEARSLTPCPNGALHTPHPCALCRAGLTEETTP